MNKIRDILNEIKWRNKYKLDELKLYYVHRGAPQNFKIISGTDIISIDKTFIETGDAMIPHHRIFKITYKEKTLFNRKEDT
jgi:uncharacterized protein (UPF0248 family)